MSASLGGASPGAYEPPSLGPEPSGDSSAPVFGQTSTSNPVHHGTTSRSTAHSGVSLAPAAAEALTIQVDTSLDPNGFDISDGLASGEDRLKAAQMVRKRSRAKAYEEDKAAKTLDVAKKFALVCLVFIVVCGIVGVYTFIAASAEADDASVGCAANNTVTRHTCKAIDKTREEDVLACNDVVALSDPTACISLHRPSASEGGPPGPARCRYSSRTDCRQAAGTPAAAPAPSQPVGPPPPSPPPRPTVAAESWEFVGGATSPRSAGQYEVDAEVWPGARSGSVTWTSGGSVFLLGGIGCGEIADGLCGDASWSRIGNSGSFGSTPGERCLPNDLQPSHMLLVHFSPCWCGWSIDYLNDLWEWDGRSWAFRGGDSTAGGGDDGGYSEPEDSTANAWPGKRSLAAVWNSESVDDDDVGHLLMFGGQTCTSCSDPVHRVAEALGDMWRADGTFSHWTWIPPALGSEWDDPATVAGIGGSGVYGSSVSIWPGARSGAGVWHHADPTLNVGYMFGGFGYGAKQYDSSGGRYQGKLPAASPD